MGTPETPPPAGGERHRRRPPPLHHPGWRVHPAPDGRGAPESPRPRRWWPWIALTAALLVVNFVIASSLPRPETRVDIPYSPAFLDQVRSGNVSEVTFRGDAIEGRLERAIRYPDASAEPAQDFATRQPPPPGDPDLVPLLREKGVTITAEEPSGSESTLFSLLMAFGPALLFVGLLVWLFRRAAGAAGGGGVMGLGRSRARRYEGADRQVTFADVAGIDEAKAELTQVVEFLRNPEPFRAIGARLPRGVLLTGPPGTGKTLLARAVAGEAGVPFFSMSASEFIEMIVGVGASRVRDLFAQAKAAAPAIIFIDELDAIGRSRTAAVNLGSSDEREQTLNQILTEMDGFDPSTGVVVLAATNRPDVLDPALLRAGRFDRRVAVQPPDREGRLAILRVHTRGIPLGADADLALLASETPGMVGADLASLVNEAALLAGSRGRHEVGRRDLEDALEKVLLGSERRVVMTPGDRERTAYHEAGHALVGMLSPHADPVRKISIIPRGAALGVTYAAPDTDRYHYTREELRTKIRVALGGRAAEELVFGDVTTGAESDIEQLTAIARQMVGRWGMSETIGPVAVVSPDPRALLLPGAAEASPDSLRLVDAEVRRIVDAEYEAAKDLLGANRDRLDDLTRALLAAESLGEEEAHAAAGLPLREPGPIPTAGRSEV